MKKIKPRNWLITITIFLVLASVLGLFFTVQKQFSFESCAYGENVYRKGENIPEYYGKNGCICNSDGSVKCDNESEEDMYSEYSSSNLKFTYRYLNSLDRNANLLEDITPGIASFSDGVMKVGFERNTLCSEDGIAPTQSGFYQINSKYLKLTIMTNEDNSKYFMPCRIENSFEITNLSLSLDNKFKIYYESDTGELIDLGACLEDGTLYGDQEVFKSKHSNSVCICEEGIVNCRSLD